MRCLCHGVFVAAVLAGVATLAARADSVVVPGPYPVVPDAQVFALDPAVPFGPLGASKPLSLKEFACVFRPEHGGKYEVNLIHPGSCCPVCVKLCLPDACLKDIHVYHRHLTLDYGKCGVVRVWFLPCGTVKVVNRT